MEVKDVVNAAIRQGWIYDPGHNKHRCIIPPGSKRAMPIPNRPVYRQMRNWIQQLKLMGLIWPEEERRERR